MLILFYKSLLHPQLKYNDAIWGPHYITDKQKVEAIQRRATWMISTCSELSYTDCLNLPSLQHRRRRGDLLLLYQIIHNHYDLHCTSFISPSTISMTRGHNMKLQKPHTNCLPRSSFFFSKSNKRLELFTPISD